MEHGTKTSGTKILQGQMSLKPQSWPWPWLLLKLENGLSQQQGQMWELGSPQAFWAEPWGFCA